MSMYVNQNKTYVIQGLMEKAGMQTLPIDFFGLETSHSNNQVTYKLVVKKEAVEKEINQLKKDIKKYDELLKKDF